jgi:hypothetical protein
MTKSTSRGASRGQSVLLGLRGLQARRGLQGRLGLRVLQEMMGRKGPQARRDLQERLGHRVLQEIKVPKARRDRQEMLGRRVPQQEDFILHLARLAAQAPLAPWGRQDHRDLQDQRGAFPRPSSSGCLLSCEPNCGSCSTSSATNRMSLGGRAHVSDHDQGTVAGSATGPTSTAWSGL